MMNEPKTSKINATALRAYIMIAVLAVIWVYFHWATDSTFLTPRNLSNLMTQMSVTGIIAVGMLMVIVSGNIDLSVGSVLGFTGGIAAFLLTTMDYGLPVAIVAVVVVGILIGIFHGVLTAYLNIPAFIVTLGGLLAWRGAVKWLLGGNTIPISEGPASVSTGIFDLSNLFNFSFHTIGNGNVPQSIGWALAVAAILFVLFMSYRRARSVKDYGLGEANYVGELLKAIIPIGGIVAFIWVMNTERGSNLVEESGIPVPVLILLAVALLGGFLTNSTVFGRYLYAIGGNADAARLSGINNKRNILKVYALLGALTGVASLIYTSRLGGAAPDAGVLKELDAIAACVIGGASLMGGRGTIFGACLGALIMASLDNGMGLIGVRDFMQDIIKGSILVAAVGLDMMGRKQT